MNEFGYSAKEGAELLDKLLVPKGYTKVEEEHKEPYWYKEYEVVEGSVWINAIIELDLTARISPERLFDCDNLFVKSYWWEYEDFDDDVDNFINVLKEAKKDLVEDLDKVYKVFQDTFVEKKPDDVYTFTCVYDDYGQFDEDGIPGVETEHEEEFDSLDKALVEFYTSISLNDMDVHLYKGNKDITDEILADESLFKKYYDNEDARNMGDFQYLTYEQSWECVKEYADCGCSELLDSYIHNGTIH